MIREKGRKLYEAINNYTVIDLETTMKYVCADNKIIEISAVKVRNNEITDTYTTLVNPECHIPLNATAVNHITNDMVEESPTINEVFPEFLEFIGNDILVGHNIDTFDLNLLYDVKMSLYNKPLTNDYIDTYHLAKRCLPELPNHKLETLGLTLGLNIDTLHRAEDDCKLTHQIYQYLKPLCNSDISPRFYEKKSKAREQYNAAQVNPNSVNNNIFLGKTCIVYGAFKQLSNNQIHNLFNILGTIYVDYFCYSANYLILGEDMYNKYLSGVEDDIISSAVSQRIPILSEYDFVRMGNINFSKENYTANFDVIDDVFGKTICLTGDFRAGTREQIINRLTELGGIVKSSVIKSLNYLIVGSNGSDQYKSGTKGSKHKLAEQYNANGANIKILTENEFIKETYKNG